MEFYLKLNEKGFNSFIWYQFMDFFKKYFIRFHKSKIRVSITQDYILLEQGKTQFFALNITLDDRDPLSNFFSNKEKKFFLRVFNPQNEEQNKAAMIAAILLKRFFPDDVKLEAKADFTSWINTAKEIEKNMNITVSQMIAMDLVALDGKTTQKEIEKAIKETPAFWKIKPVEKLPEEEKDYILIPDNVELSDEERKMLEKEVGKPLKYSHEIDNGFDSDSDLPF